MESKDITKESIRKRIWSYMEDKNIARFPRPVYNRIPNFEGAEKACSSVRNLLEYQTAHTVKVNPDSPQKHIRFLILEDNKELYVPTPRLKNGLLNKIIPPLNANKEMLRLCSTHEGVRNYSAKIGLNKSIKIDLVILGSVAVSPKAKPLNNENNSKITKTISAVARKKLEGYGVNLTLFYGQKGYRIGKGEGYADMEFAMMSTMKAVNSETVVVSTVHDCQVLDSIPDYLFGDHDVPVDIIVTPTRTIRCEPRLPKPDRIIWHLLTEEKIKEIPILKVLNDMEEKNKS